MRYIIATHGDLASALKQTIEMIVGEQEGLITLGLQPGVTGESFKEKLVNEIGNEEALVFVDIVGGTPFNSIIDELRSEKVAFVSGVNLGMMLEVILNSELSSLEQTADFAKKKGIESIITKYDLFSERSGV